MYYRSMTLAERAAYESVIREWFPNISLTFRFEQDFPGQTPGDQDTLDTIDWSFYRNGFNIQGQIIDQMMIYSEDEFGRFHVYDALQSRQIIRETIFASNEAMFPLFSEGPPSLQGAARKAPTSSVSKV